MGPVQLDERVRPTGDLPNHPIPAGGEPVLVINSVISRSSISLEEKLSLQNIFKHFIPAKKAHQQLFACSEVYGSMSC